MSSFCVSYPVTERVLETCKAFPRLVAELRLALGTRSPFEAVRLLHHSGQERNRDLLRLMDECLPVSGKIGHQLVRATDPFQFLQTLSELLLLVQLRERLGDKASPAEAPCDQKAEDISVEWRGTRVRIEVFTPLDFMGLQLIHPHVTTMLEYLDVPFGFKVEVTLGPVADTVDGLWYPYSLHGEKETLPWLHQLARRVQEWLPGATPGAAIDSVCSGEQAVLRIRLRARRSEPECRGIAFDWESYSTDTSLYFDCGDARTTAACLWGRKLREKLRKRQAGQPDPRTIRILVWNFSLAETSQPEFICEERFVGRMDEAVRLVASQIDPPLPYDAVIPAQILRSPGFGPAIWLNQGKRATGATLLEEAGLDQPCRPPLVEKVSMEELFGKGAADSCSM